MKPHLLSPANMQHGRARARALTSRPRPLRSSRSSLVEGASSEYRWEDADWRKRERAPGSSPTFGRITEEREDTIFKWEVNAPIDYLCTLRASNDALAHPRLCPHTRRTSIYQRLAAMQICEWTFRVLGLARLPARHVGHVYSGKCGCARMDLDEHSDAGSRTAHGVAAVVVARKADVPAFQNLRQVPGC